MVYKNCIVEDNILISVNKNIVNFEIPNGVKIIGDRVFKNCIHLEDVYIPDSVIEIGNRSFELCPKLKTINIPDSVTSIGGYAFMYSALISIKLPKFITTIKAYTFSTCTHLEEVNIPSYVKTISLFAFSNCTKLKFINVSDSIKYIDNFAFYNTPFENIHKKLGENEFINFLKEKDKSKYVSNKRLNLKDIVFLLDDTFKGFKEGLNYGI